MGLNKPKKGCVSQIIKTILWGSGIFVIIISVWYITWLVVQSIEYYGGILKNPNSFNPLFEFLICAWIYACSGIVLTTTIFLISKFILPLQAFNQIPVENPSNDGSGTTAADYSRQQPSRWTALSRIIRYIIGRHGPSYIIREGKVRKPLEKDIPLYPGVAWVDLNSAIVLEKRWDLIDRVFSNTKEEVVEEIISPVVPPLARVCGPGLVFTQSGEALRGAVSLRKQFRISKPIRGMTSDGIEVETMVFSIFTLGQPPPILHVTHMGNFENPEHIRVLKINHEKMMVTGYDDELDLDDKIAIHDYVMLSVLSNPGDQSIRRSKPEQDGPFTEWPPYFYDPERVFSAVYSNAHQTGDQKIERWTDLPIKICTDLYLNLLCQYNFDDLFLPNKPGPLPWKEELKPKLNICVRNQGALSFQYILRRDGAPILLKDMPARGLEIKLNRTNHYFYQIMDLKTRKDLRDRGIKVIYSGLTTLRPVNPQIMAQRFENWQVRWQRAANATQAEYAREALRWKNQARAEAQRRMVYSLSQILKDNPVSQEILALRLFEALEAAASDPSTRQLLPEDTITLLSNLNWLFLDDPRGWFLGGRS
jgi:hypothetical protein